MRYSHQRELILREVLSRSDYPTAEQICTSLRAVCPRLSLGTVYRDLNTLVDIGKVRRVSIPGEADRFEGPQEDHQQLYCRSCQKVKSIHISDAKLKALIDACPDIVPEDYSLPDVHRSGGLFWHLWGEFCAKQRLCVVLRGKLWYTIYRIVYVLPCAVRPDQNSGGKTYAPTAV